MNLKTGVIIAVVFLGCCCLMTAGLMAVGLLTSDDTISASPSPGPSTTTPPAGGNASLGGYLIYGTSTPIADGFADSLEGNWMLIDGAAVESIEEIHSDHVVVRSRRSGELWHFTFESDGSYTYRYVITGSLGAVIWVEKGQWTSDGASLTLTPESCFSKAPGERTECLEPAVRTYTLTTVQMEELTPNERKGATWKGVRFTGPFPSYSQGAQPVLVPRAAASSVDRSGIEPDCQRCKPRSRAQRISVPPWCPGA